MSSRGKCKSIEEFLNDLEPELMKYAQHLRDQGFTSTSMLKFLKLKDLQNIPFVVPAPHRRMILNAVAKLQSPNTKIQIESPVSETLNQTSSKRNAASYVETVSSSFEMSNVRSAFEPRTLFSEDTPSESKPEKRSAHDIVLQEKLELEKQFAKLKSELSEFNSQPVELMPLALPGNRMMMVTCAQCHHRGHRKDGNKNGLSCEFESCVGYHYCGNEKLHPEFKTKKREKEKVLKTIREKIDAKRTELEQLEDFAAKSKTNFVRNVRPRLQRHFPSLYKGKDGMQRLLRDVRYVKLACGGKIPPVSENDRENLQQLIQNGNRQVSADFGMLPDSENFLKPENELNDPFPIVNDDERDESTSSLASNTQDHVYDTNSISAHASNTQSSSSAIRPIVAPAESEVHTRWSMNNQHQATYLTNPCNVFPYGNAYLHHGQIVPAPPPALHAFPNYIHPAMAMALSSQNLGIIENQNASMDIEPNNAQITAEFGTSMMESDNRVGNENDREPSYITATSDDTADRSRQTLLDLANVALQN